MDPTTVVGPHLACPARGPAGPRHSRIPARRDRWFLGTAFYRLRTSAETVTLVVTLMAHGGPLPAIVVAFGLDERTVASGLGRAGGGQGQAVPPHLVEQPRDLGQVQADESRVKKQGGIVGMALALLGSRRLWLAGEGSEHRDLPLLRRLLKRVPSNTPSCCVPTACVPPTRCAPDLPRGAFQCHARPSSAHRSSSGTRRGEW
jgi:hypothetical protein